MQAHSLSCLPPVAARTGRRTHCAVALYLIAVIGVAEASEPRLTLRAFTNRLELAWSGEVPQTDGSVLRPFFEVQSSTDLFVWQPIGERQRAGSIASTELRMPLGPDNQTHAFFRLIAEPQRSTGRMGSGGAEVFGFGEALAGELGRIGQISPDDFAARFPPPADYLEGISWDPTGAEFWDWFNADPEEINCEKGPGDHGYRMIDTRLSEPEVEVLRQHGFVVSERLKSRSFAQAFHDLWYSDLPVFVSTDALLQAWHRTYDGLLEELEETRLHDGIAAVLEGMARAIPSAASQAAGGALASSVRDADYYLAVARSLLQGIDRPPVVPVLGQDPRVAATLRCVRDRELDRLEDFMGFCRVVDFSQFEVRGHYLHSERLGRYYQCMLWLSRIDLPVAGGPFRRCPGEERDAAPRELGTAIVLWDLLHQSGQFANWAEIERTIAAFVGWSDSLNAAQLGGLLAGAGIRTLADVSDIATLQRLQSEIARGELGVQNIRSDWYAPPLKGAGPAVLPRTFALMGQRFVPDSWALSQTVYDSVPWEENGHMIRVPRRVPGALDVAFAVLGNDHVVPELVAQMKGTYPDLNRPHALRFRDGLPYQHQLAAVRAVIDQ